jgi:hypothetical protein
MQSAGQVKRSQSTQGTSAPRRSPKKSGISPAVIIALILICLLAVILILQIAPDSGAAAWIDSLIESITSRFNLIMPGIKFLL